MDDIPKTLQQLEELDHHITQHIGSNLSPPRTLLFILLPLTCIPLTLYI